MIQQSNEQMARWKEYVTEKRKLENLENTRKMEEMKQSLRQSQRQLEKRIREKEEQAARLRRAVEERKVWIYVFFLNLKIIFTFYIILYIMLTALCHLFHFFPDEVIVI